MRKRLIELEGRAQLGFVDLDELPLNNVDGLNGGRCTNVMDSGDLQYVAALILLEELRGLPRLYAFKHVVDWLVCNLCNGTLQDTRLAGPDQRLLS